MAQLSASERNRRFYRYTFELRNNGKSVYTHTLLLNPSDMSFDEPPRINAVQTLGGAYITNFGRGLAQVTISGVTGFNARMNTAGVVMDGYTEWKALRDQVYRYYVNTMSSQVEMYWYNWEDDEYYKVVPLSFRLMRNKAEAKLYRYELRFICTKRLNSAEYKTANAKEANMKASLQTAFNKLDPASPGSALTEIMLSFSGYKRSGA